MPDLAPLIRDPSPRDDPPSAGPWLTAPSGAGDPRTAPELDPPDDRSVSAGTELLGERWRDRVDDLVHRVGGRRLVAWVVAGAVALAVGAWLLRPAPRPLEETLPATTATPAGAAGAPAAAATAGPGPDIAPGAPTPGVPPPTTPTELVAHAAGAVARPGVYRLDPAARVDDLVRAAGGLAPEADASRLNLAAPLADGARVYVPRQGEEVPAAVGPEGGAAPPGGATGPGTGGGVGPDGGSGPLVDLNTADEAALDELPGVGPATATAIVAHRQEVGGFGSVDELLDVRGIGEAKLEQLRPLVTV